MSADAMFASLRSVGERLVPLGQQLGVANVGLNLFTLQKGQGSRIHRHLEQEELYVVLDGELTIQLETRAIVVPEHFVARVGAPTKQQLLNSSDEPCVFLAIGAIGSHARGDAEAFGGWDDREPRRPSEVPVPEDVL